MKPEIHKTSKISARALAAILAFALMTGALSACSIGGNGSTNNPEREYGGDSKPSYESADETNIDETDETTADDTTDDGPAPVANPDGYQGNFNMDDWHIREFTDFDITYTQVSNSGRHGRSCEMDYLVFKVYESEADAQKAYEHYYDQSKDYDRGHWEEGANWFISDEWGVMDVSIVWMVYREGNILIIADLAMNGKWRVYDKETNTVEYSDTESSFKGFVMNNVEEIVKFVNEYFFNS